MHLACAASVTWNGHVLKSACNFGSFIFLGACTADPTWLPQGTSTLPALEQPGVLLILSMAFASGPRTDTLPQGLEVVVSGKCASHRVICSYNLGCGGKMHASGLGWCGCVALEEAHVFKEVGSILGALLLALHLDGENDHHFRPVSRNSTSDRKCQVPLCPSPLTNPH